MLRIPLPAALVEQARAYASGELTPVEPRNAATVVLMRPSTGTGSSSGGPEVYLLRRQASMAFAAGMCVFPGGGVDPRDFYADVAWHGPSPEDWEEDRRALEAREVSFTSFLERRGLRLRTDLLRLWGSWVTPVFEPRRFNARFFVAELPAGQVTRDVSTESEAVVWLPVREAIRAVDAQQMLMLPPTYCTCLEVYDFTRVGDVLAAAEGRDLSSVEPEAVVDDEGAYLSIPDRLVTLGEDVSARLYA